MLTAAALLLVLGAAVAVALRLGLLRGGPLDEVTRFQAARDMTNRWSGDPSTTPQPLRDYLEAQHHADDEPA